MTTKTWVAAYIIANAIILGAILWSVNDTWGIQAAVAALVGIALTAYVMFSGISGQWFYKK